MTAPPGSDEEREKAQRRATFVLSTYEKMGYHVLNVGETDLALGVEYLLALQKRSGIAFVSANLKEAKTGKTIFNPYVIKELNGMKIGIIGLLSPYLSRHRERELRGYFVQGPIETAIEAIKGPLANCDFVIALARLNHAEIESLAKMVPRISIIIDGSERSFTFPQPVNHSVCFQIDAFGFSVGRLDSRLVDARSEFVDVSARTSIRKNIEEIQKRIDNPEDASESEELKNMQRILVEREENLPDIANKNTYENYPILFHRGMESDPEVVKQVSSAKDQLR